MRSEPHDADGLLTQKTGHLEKRLGSRSWLDNVRRSLLTLLDEDKG